MRALAIPLFAFATFSLAALSLTACGDINVNFPDPRCPEVETTQAEADMAPLPQGCFEHADCLEGMRCDTSNGYPYGGSANSAACFEGEPCCGEISAGARVVWDGVCTSEPIEPAVYCESDLDCVGEQRCDLVTQCPAGESARRVEPDGCEDAYRCLDPMVGVVCTADGDCGGNEECRLLENETWGYCGERVPVGEGCEIMECGAGLSCQEYEVCEDWCDQTVEDPECCYLEASCVETTEPVEPPPAECTDDSDCGPDEFCDYFAGADAPAICQPAPNDEPCADLPAAFCEEVEGCFLVQELTSCPDADPNEDCDMPIEVCVGGPDA